MNGKKKEEETKSLSGIKLDKLVQSSRDQPMLDREKLLGFKPAPKAHKQTISSKHTTATNPNFPKKDSFLEHHRPVPKIRPEHDAREKQAARGRREQQQHPPTRTRGGGGARYSAREEKQAPHQQQGGLSPCLAEKQSSPAKPSSRPLLELYPHIREDLAEYFTAVGNVHLQSRSFGGKETESALAATTTTTPDAREEAEISRRGHQPSQPRQNLADPTKKVPSLTARRKFPHSKFTTPIVKSNTKSSMGGKKRKQHPDPQQKQGKGNRKKQQPVHARDLEEVQEEATIDYNYNPSTGNRKPNFTIEDLPYLLCLPKGEGIMWLIDQDEDYRALTTDAEQAEYARLFAKSCLYNFSNGISDHTWTKPITLTNSRVVGTPF